MSFASKSQAHLFYASQSGYKYATNSVPQKVASKFIKDTDHQKLKSLPERVGHPQHNIQKHVAKHQASRYSTETDSNMGHRPMMMHEGAEDNRKTE